MTAVKPTRRDYEDKIGVDHLDELHEDRRVLVETLAPLEAMFGARGGHRLRQKRVTVMTTAANKKLYEITAEYRDISDRITEAGGELTPEIMADLEQLDRVEGGFTRKAERVAHMIRSHERKAEAHTAFAKAIVDSAKPEFEKAKEQRNAAESLKAYLHHNMQALELTKVKGDLLSVSVQKSTPRVMGDYTESELADMASHSWYGQFVKVSRALDRKKIAAVWKSGGEIPKGVEIKRGTHLRIR